MRRLLIALAAILAAAAAAHAQPASSLRVQPWSVSVEQDGKTQPFRGVVRLKKAPFVFVIEGPKSYGYIVIASTGESEIKPMTSKAAIDRYINPAMMIAVSRPREGRSLFVCKDGRIHAERGAFDTWEEDEELGVLSFQTVRNLAGGRMSARREITGIDIGDGDKNLEYKIEDYPDARVFMVITANPPVGYMAHLDPRQATLEFAAR